MRETDPNVQRYRELLRLKRRLLTQMSKHRKSLARDRADKKRINEEITKLRKSGYAFSGMTAVAAQERVGDEIRAVKPEDIYPKDLERQFDKLERTTEVKYKKGLVDLDDLENDGPSHSVSSEDDSPSIFIGKNSGVIDLGEGEVDDTELEPDAE